VAKNHNFGQILTFGGSCTDTLLPMRFILSSSGSKKPQFLPFFGIRHLVMSTVGVNLSKLNTGAQLQIFACLSASKLFLYSNAFMAKSGEQTLTFKSVADRQKRNVFCRLGGGLNPSPTKLGMVIEDLEHVHAPLKRLGVWRIVSPLGGIENLGVTKPRQIFKFGRSLGHRRDMVIFYLKITAVASGVVEGGTRNMGERRSSKYFLGTPLSQMMSGFSRWYT